MSARTGSTGGAERPIAGERIVITGATNGIGLALADALAQRGAALTLVARNRNKADGVSAQIAVAHPDAPVPDVVVCDLGDLSSVRSAAAEIGDRYPAIDVLVNNAGINAMAPEITPDGFDVMMATNHLGPFLLTNLLLGQVTASAPARIVNTASEAHRFGGTPKLDKLGQPESYGALSGQPVYGRSKLMNILFTAELARRLAGTGVTANCFCPGFVATGLAGSAAPALTVLSRTPIVRRPEQGMRMGLRLIVDPAFDQISGRFYSSTPGSGLLPAVRVRSDAAFHRAAWERSAELVGIA